MRAQQPAVSMSDAHAHTAFAASGMLRTMGTRPGFSIIKTAVSLCLVCFARRMLVFLRFHTTVNRASDGTHQGIDAKAVRAGSAQGRGR